MSKTNRTERVDSKAIEETLKLYHGWLGYLLTRMDEKTLRVPVKDIRSALDSFTCTVAREGDEYVIRLGGEEGDGHGGEATDVG